MLCFYKVVYYCVDVIAPVIVPTQGYIDVFCLCYSYKWVIFRRAAVKDDMFFPSHSYCIAFIVAASPK